MKHWNLEYNTIRRLLLVTFTLAFIMGFSLGFLYGRIFMDNTSFQPLHDNHYIVYGTEFGSDPSCLGCHFNGTSYPTYTNGEISSIYYVIQISNLTIGKSYIIATTRDIVFFHFNGTLPHLFDYFFKNPTFNQIEISLFQYKNDQFFAYNQLGNRDNLLFLDYYRLEW